MTSLPDDPVETPPVKGGPRIKPRDYGPPPFIKKLGKTDSVRTPLGHYRTESLFLEQWRPIDSARPVYTLQRDDREDPRVPGSILPSFQRRYIELGDPSSYKAALDLLGSWQHWQKLAKTPWFQPHLRLWNEEIVAQMKSKGVETFVRSADRGDLKAAEWLVGYSLEGPPVKHGRGRPSRSDINKAAKDTADAERNLEHDAARLGITRS